MGKSLKFGLLLSLSIIVIVAGQGDNSWELGPFIKDDSVNPFLLPLNTTEFHCPIRNSTVYWESKDVFNPTALVKDGLIHLIYRAEDVEGAFLGTSRLGLTVSNDGLHFNRSYHTTPIFYPDLDEFQEFEWEGGCEDPRIVENEAGRYFMTYTGFNGEVELARLMVASSDNLFQWTKYGLTFPDHPELWSKSGSIVSKLVDEKFVAQKINGKYWMYWGDTDIYVATSDDLIKWTIMENDDPSNPEKLFKPIISPRPGYFDSDLVEPGPQAILRDDGILLIYNSRNKPGNEGGDPEIEDWTYTAGQVLLNSSDPTQILKRSEKFFMQPEKPYEIDGQVNKVVFLEGLVFYQKKWFVYYGTADSKIAVAVYDTTSKASPNTISSIFLTFLTIFFIKFILV